MPSLDQLKDKDKFNGSDDPDSIPFATYLGLVTARCVQQDIGHVLVDTDPNQRTHRLVNVMEDDPDGGIDRFGSLTVAQQFNHYRKLLQFTGFSFARGVRAVERGSPIVCLVQACDGVFPALHQLPITCV